MADSTKTTRRYDEVALALDRIEKVLAEPDSVLFADRPGISGWSIAGHLHHVAVSYGMMLGAAIRCCREQAPAEPGGHINAIGRAVLLSGRMPRGKGRAPERTHPPETPDRKDLAVAVERSRRALQDARALLPQMADASWRAPHPYFGALSAMEWLRLAAIHTDHHLRIVAEIQDAT